MSTRLDQLKSMLDNDSENSFLNYALSLEYNKAGDLKMAIDVLEKLLEKEPSYLGAYYQLAKFHIQNADGSNAVNVLERGQKVAQNQGDQKTLGEILQLLAEIEE
jgi:Tfp pilus assembly protein PilF